MKCPICNYPCEAENSCPSCGTDVILYHKIIKISNMLYNKALRLAENNDLSGATESLKKCLAFDKSNIDARNLLALIYYETGKVGDALKNFHISYYTRKDNNVALKYIEAIKKGSKEIETATESIKMYNQALVYLKTKSEDMAIIQLKKAVELNPKFIDAINLLTLCYMMQSDTVKASLSAEKAILLAPNNATSKNYYSILTPSRPRSSSRERAKTANEKPALEYYQRNRTARNGSARNNSRNKSTVTAIVGAIIAIVLFGSGFAVLSSQKSTGSKFNELKIEFEKSKIAYEDTINKQAEDIVNLTGQVKSMTDTNNALNLQVQQNKTIQKVDNAEKLMKENKNEEAIVALQSIDVASLPADDIEKFNTIKTTAFGKYSDSLYNKGRVFYTKANYTEAKASFENCMNYVSTTASYIDDIYYYLGRIAEIDKDTSLAKQNYEKLISEYPTSNQFKNAQNRLKNLS